MARSQLKPNGFTLVELLIVVSLAVMILLSASALFMTFLIGNTKTTTAQLVKREGDHALDQMEFLIRNAIALPTCEADMSTLVVQSRDGQLTTLTRVTDTDGVDKIASNSAFLTSASLELMPSEDNGGPEFDCQSTSGGGQYVTITFKLRKGTPGVEEDREIVQQTFSTGVQVRSF